jgi:DnaJ-class molecular chaperone
MTLTKQDLMVPCPRCNGTGRETLPADPPAKPQTQTCRACHGRKVRLTETGEAIRALILLLKQNGEI